MKNFSDLLLKISAFSLVLSFTVLTFAYTGKVLYESNKDNISNISSAALNEEQKSVIIDAGHGGEDGGAVSKINGILEKDVNLSVALTVSDLLKAMGIDVILTRDDDTLLYDANTKGTKKSQDLKNRLMFTVNNPNSVFVSIHMNTFPREKYSGLQVFYSPNNDSSKKLADMLQSNTAFYIQNENKRETKRANSSIYILWRTTIPAVLVECGFLSNPKEAELLSTDAYRKKLAAVISSSVCTYLALDENTEINEIKK